MCESARSVAKAKFRRPVAYGCALRCCLAVMRPSPVNVKKMLKVRGTFDYGSRPLLQLASYPFKERSSNLHVQALSQRNFV